MSKKTTDTQRVGAKRYQGLIITIGALLSMIIALLVYNFYAANLLTQDAIVTDESHKLSTTAQVIIKDSFDLENSFGEHIRSPHMQRVLARLRENAELMEHRLQDLQHGGAIQMADGSIRQLEAVDTNKGRRALEEANKQWHLIKPYLETYLNNVETLSHDSSNDLHQLLEQTKTSSLHMTSAFNELTDSVVADANKTANTIRYVQVAAVLVIFLYFLGFILVFMRRLRESDAQVLAAQRETEEIMRTVNTGLFLLDKNLKLGNQYSHALVDIIGTDNLAGESLSTILRNRISDKDLRTAEEFVEQLYNPRVKEKLVNSLNPLNKVIFHDGKSGSRYLDFTFSRVYEDREIARILVNINDVSEEVRLAQRLEKERVQNDRQIEMLTTILNVSPKVINDFISATYARIEKINNVLKSSGGSQFELENKLKAIYREMHSLKGEASALKLHSFTQIASEAEDKLHALQNQSRLSGDDFLSLTVHLDELLTLSNTIQELSKRINSTMQTGARTLLDSIKPAVNSATAPASNQPLANQAMPTAEAPPASQTAHASHMNDESSDAVFLFEDEKKNDGLADYLAEFGRDIAERQGKHIEVDTVNMAIAVPENLLPIVKELSIQLLRNAIVHGIADSQTRVSNGKPPVGKINIALSEHSVNGRSYIALLLEDDGKGIDYDGIRQKLVASGRYSPEKTSQLTQNQLLEVLFSSGFSTRDSADEDGGRGVGLDIVKDRVKQYNGKIQVQTEKGKFTRFIIRLPMTN